MLPGPIQRSLGIRKVRIIPDPVTGLPVLTAGEDAPVLSSKDIEEILANFS